MTAVSVTLTLCRAKTKSLDSSHAPRERLAYSPVNIDQQDLYQYYNPLFNNITVTYNMSYIALTLLGRKL